MLTWWILNGPITCFKQIHSTKSTSCVLVSMFSSLVTIHNLLRNANFVDGMFFFLFWWLFALVSRLVGVLWVNKRSLLKIVAVKLWKSANFFRQNVGLHKKKYSNYACAFNFKATAFHTFSATIKKLFK